MSHSVTITRTTTTTGTTSALIINTGYLKTIPGLLKLVQLILGVVCVGIMGWYWRGYYRNTAPDLFFFLMTCTFMIATFCLLVSCLFSLSTGGIISKTIYELIYHSIACVLLLAASLTFLIDVTNNKYSYRIHETYMAAAIIGLINAVLYCISAIYAQRSYRGI